MSPRLSKETLLMLRRALLGLLAAVDVALLEAHGWAPREHATRQ